MNNKTCMLALSSGHDWFQKPLNIHKGKRACLQKISCNQILKRKSLCISMHCLETGVSEPKPELYSSAIVLKKHTMASTQHTAQHTMASSQSQLNICQTIPPF